MAMSATRRAAPAPTPTPMPSLVLLERPLESGVDVEFDSWPAVESLVCEGSVADPVCVTPRDEAADAGVAVGVNETPIFFASDVAYPTGKSDKSFDSQATYGWSAMAVPLEIVDMLDMVDLSLMTCS
jgi:hypothetical protein